MSGERTGFQPRTTPAERRAFFDQLRKTRTLEERLAALEETSLDHETRLEALEP